MSIVDDYYAWLKNLTFLEQLNDTVTRISLPFLDRNNDYIEIYIVKQSESCYLLTDDGETYNELVFSGIEFTAKRKEFLNNIVISFGVSIDKNHAIYVIANTDELFFKKHMLVQCMLKLSDLFLTKSSNVKSLFTEDIASFLDEHDVRFTENISIVGKSKLVCQFDFIIPKSKNAPERLIKGINNLDNNTAKLLIFSWEDTKDVRKDESCLFAFINNIDKNVKRSAFTSLTEYGITPVSWSDRRNVIEALIA